MLELKRKLNILVEVEVVWFKFLSVEIV